MLLTIRGSDASIHLGKLLLTGRILRGTASPGDKLSVLTMEGEKTGDAVIGKMYKRIGTKRYEIDHAVAGDIVTLGGVTNARVTDTLCHPSEEEKGAIDGPKLDPPTISMFFSVNDSPLAGRKEESGGTKLTSQVLQERLYTEAATNIGIQIKPAGAVDGREAWEVQGRGEMQLGILIENMRREGFEMSVSPPKALMKTIDGKKMEPVDEVRVDVAEDLAGGIIETMMSRKGEMVDSAPNEDGTRRRSIFHVPVRGTVGLRSELIRLSRGDVIMSTCFHEYQEYKGPMGEVRKGVMISAAVGVSTLHAMGALEARGSIHIGVGQAVYEGMVVGECARSTDMMANVCKTKKLTNVRAAGKDESVRLTPPRQFTLEEYIGYIQDDELIEITPKNIRVRKALLTESARKQAKGRGKR